MFTSFNRFKRVFLSRQILVMATSSAVLGGLVAALILNPKLVHQVWSKPPSYEVDEVILGEYQLMSTQLSESAMHKGNLQSASSKLENSVRMYEQGKICQAIHHLGVLNNYLMQVGDNDKNSDAVAEMSSVMAMAWNLQAELASTPEGEDCEEFDANTGEPSTEIGESNNMSLTFTVEFARPSLTTIEENGETYTQVHVDGVDNQTGEIGTPAVPMWRSLIGVPYGSTPMIQMANAMMSEGNSIPMMLYPIQPQPVDQSTVDQISPEPDPETFANPPFEIDEEAYNQEGFYPEMKCSVELLGQYRDLQMAQVECATGEFSPTDNQYNYFDGMEVEIMFEGATTESPFMTTRSQSAFEPQTELYASSVLNYEVIPSYLEEIVPPGFCSGEELLILTHPDFRDAADRLRDWKNSKGIITSVFNVNDGAASGPDTNSEIDDFIEDRYNDCNVRPSYVMLMGDAEFIPTFYVSTGGSATTGSDYQYAVYPQFFFDIFPDFGVGRIPVDTLAQADTVVDKIINYEQSPPTFGAQASTFYGNATIASQFQCCRYDTNGNPLGGQAGRTQRTFTEVSEFARNVLVGQGKSVDRIYHQTIDANYNGDTTPRRYYDGDLLPAVLGPTGTYNWNVPEATRTQDIIDSWNAGRFLVIHRDHGWKDGWGNPYFDSNNVSNDLTNGAYLPVVYSVNCASGLFDNETAAGDYGTNSSSVYFAERLLRKADGGAIGVLGDTRNSPSWPNTALTMGFVDATWPAALGGFGSNVSQHRLGDILNHGKLFMLTQIDVPGAGVSAQSAIDELFMWHVIGDPTLEMRTSQPFNLGFEYEFVQLPEFFRFFYEENGVEVTAYQVINDEILPIGRAIVENGEAEIPFEQTPDAEATVFLSVCKTGTICQLLNPEEEEPENGEISGMKFYDLNANAEKDESEPGLEDWVIVLSDMQGVELARTTTDAEGNYSFVDVEAGQYIVSEVQQSSWTQTYPATNTHSVDIKEGEILQGLDFGNTQIIN